MASDAYREVKSIAGQKGIEISEDDLAWSVHSGEACLFLGEGLSSNEKAIILDIIHSVENTRKMKIKIIDEM